METFASALEESAARLRRGDSFDTRWPRRAFPSLHLTPAQVAALKRRQGERRRLLRLIGDDIINLSLETTRGLLNGNA